MRSRLETALIQVVTGKQVDTLMISFKVDAFVVLSWEVEDVDVTVRRNDMTGACAIRVSK